MKLFNDVIIEPKLGSIKKFYFFDYFYIFLRSVAQQSKNDMVFDHFKILKDEHKLAESRFKKLISETQEITSVRLIRYKYTFNEVKEEALLYKLVSIEDDKMFLTERGEFVLNKYNPDKPEDFNFEIFKLMESELHGFYQMVKYCYKANKNGLLIFPMYSPLKLEISRSELKTTEDIILYNRKLAQKLEDDLKKYVFATRNLTEPSQVIINKLKDAELLAENHKEKFEHKHFNMIIRRIRDFWINYFLKEIYEIPLSLSFFDIWCYRGKQLGIINITEFYYNFSGRIVYPTSIIARSVSNSDFRNIFTYSTGECLFIHEPDVDKLQEKFSRVVYDSYMDLRHHYSSYFINIAALRDVVCYKLKISYRTFHELFEKLYFLNLQGLTTIKISLEADRLPEETKAMYQKREPIIIEGKLRNIIAIDLKNK